MILEFLDGSQLEVLNIFGGPRLVFGVMRDTLSIEVSPSTCSFEDLKRHFKDNPKTGSLYTYSDDAEPVRMVLGEGYKIFVSISDESREVPRTPGKLVPNVTEEVYIVTIAQMTYQEYLLEGMGNQNIPEDSPSSEE